MTEIKHHRDRSGTSQRATMLLHGLSRPLPSRSAYADMWIGRAAQHVLPEERQIDPSCSTLQMCIRNGGSPCPARMHSPGTIS